MNWFAGILANVINLVANGVGLLVNTATNTRGLTNTAMGNVILHGFFPFENLNQYPSWGEGNFSDLIDQHAVSTLSGFATAFEAFGWAFFLASVYLLVMQIVRAEESAVQRDRLKKGMVSLFVAMVLIVGGSHFAVLITQMFFYMSDYFINLHPIENWTSLKTSGNQALLNSIVNLIQSVLSIIVWIVYQFRLIFLYIWMIFFPLAMAFYANDKTRGITKMWWTEWIYQMAVPFGQAVVYGVSSAVASPSKSGAALTAADLFVALSGTIGLLLSATYVRKLIDVVAQGFGTSVLGSGHGMAWGTLAMAGGAAATMDVTGKAAIHSSKFAAKQTVGRGLKMADQKWGSKIAKQAIEKHGEAYTGAIQAGATADDIVMMKSMGGASGDAIGAGGAGMETAGRGSPGSSMGTGGGGGRSGATGNRHPLTPILQSRTASALKGTHQDMRQGLQNSHFGTWAAVKRQAWENEGGTLGYVSRKISPKILQGLHHEKVKALPGAKGMASGVQRHLLQAENKKEKLDTLRMHLQDALQRNEAMQRVPAMTHLYDPETHEFQPSAAEQKYNTAREQLHKALQGSGLSSEVAQRRVEQFERLWQGGKHWTHLSRYSLETQQAYRQAYSAYHPAQKDKQAKELVLQGKVNLPVYKDPVAEHKAKTPAFLNDARNAVAYRR